MMPNSLREAVVAEEDHYGEHEGPRLAALLRQHPVQQEEAEHEDASPPELLPVALDGGQVSPGQVYDEYEHQGAEEHGAHRVSYEDQGEGQDDCVGRGVYCEEDEDWDEDEACEEGILPTGDQGEVEAEGGGAASEEEAESHHQKEGQYGRWPFGHLERLPNIVV